MATKKSAAKPRGHIAGHSAKSSQPSDLGDTTDNGTKPTTNTKRKSLCERS